MNIKQTEIYKLPSGQDISKDSHLAPDLEVLKQRIKDIMQVRIYQIVSINMIHMYFFFINQVMIMSKHNLPLSAHPFTQIRCPICELLSTYSTILKTHISSNVRITKTLLAD